MKLSRTFSQMAKPDGRMVYRRRQTLIAPVTIIRAVLTLDPQWAEKTFRFACFLDGKLLARGEGRGAEPFVFTPDLRLPRGEREIRVVAKHFQPDEIVTGRIEVEYTLF